MGDWVVKKGHAFAFWREADSSLSLEVFAGITVAGVALQVELYDTNRTRIKEERKEESKEADPKKNENVEKKGRTESDKKGVAADQESKIEHKNVKSEDSKKNKDESVSSKKT